MTVTVTDGVAVDATDTFSWTVSNTNQDPTFDQDLPDQTDAEGDVITGLDAGATDPDGDTLTYAATGLPAGLRSITATGLISGTIALSAASGSPYAVTVTVTRRRGGRRHRHLQLDGHQHQPGSDLRPGRARPDRRRGRRHHGLDAGATDPDGDTADLRRHRPAGRPVDRHRHRPISGTIALSAASGSPYAVTVTVTRRRAVDATDTFSWTVTNTNQHPTFDQNLPDQTDAEGDVITGLDAGATDPDGDTADLRRHRPAGRPAHQPRHRPDQRHHRPQRRQRQPLRGDRHRHATTRRSTPPTPSAGRSPTPTRIRPSTRTCPTGPTPRVTSSPASTPAPPTPTATR